jgi:DNA-binding CsgD family transcriptional regulator/catechol 2,3-dioxygenase-like lactoylglutathione lyase family enzyme
MTSSRPGRPRHDDVLTPAEWRVAEWVRHGLTNRRIAERMGVSIDAVKFHVGNALSKLGLLSREELRRWDGVAKGTALHMLRRSTMNAQMPALGEIYMMLGQIARTVADAEDSRRWYRDVLGLPELYAFPGLAFFDLSGVRLMLTEEDGGTGPAESIRYLRLPDIHVAKQELESRGVKFINAPHLIHRHEDGTEEWLASFEDNEGRPLQLMAQVRGGAATA